MRSIPALALLCLTTAAPLVALAGQTVVVPGITARTTYDDNLFFDNVSDLEARVSPSLTLERNTDTTRAALKGIVDVYRYASEDRYDRVNQQYNLKVSHQATERVGVSADVGFSRDYTFDDVFEETGFVTDRSLRNTYSLRPGISYSLTERTAARLFYDYSQRDYDRPRFTDSVLHGAQLLLSHSLQEEVSTVFASLQVQQVTYDQPVSDTEQMVYQASIGLEYRFSPVFALTVAPGMAWTKSEFTRAGEDQEITAPTFTLNAEGEWTHDRTQFSLGVSRLIEQSVYGENITVDRVGGTLTHGLTERLTAALSAAYTHSTTEELLQDRTVRAISLNPRLSYGLTEDARLTVGYEFRDGDEDGSENDRRRNQVYGELSFGFPGFY